MTFFRELWNINNEDPEVFALCHRTSPGQSVWTRCGQEVRTAQRANNAAGPKAVLRECAPCWTAERRVPRTQAKAARELEGLLAQVSTLELPHPGARWTITLRTVHPGRWLVTYDGASCPMVFSPDGTEWEAADEVVMACREACEAVTLPLPEAVALAERLLADGGPIYPLGDPLREQMRARN
ncbi:hypothetical protein ABZ234_08120 [Nocardiopsis sp. NPDC006198]|uniref:hypothetical protein n=1 Tax=Nocardiopsis sp. NPDC006198 TaxID=3154472 RepID=UPI0033A0C5EC